MALQAAMKKSREEELQRRMAAQGLEASYDDIFDTESVNQSFENESGMDESEIASEAMMERDLDGILKPGVREAKARFVEVWTKLTENWKESSKLNEDWKPFPAFSRGLYGPACNSPWEMKKGLALSKRCSAPASGRASKGTTTQGIDDH